MTNENNEEYLINLSIETKGIDEAIQKLNQFKTLLQEVQELAASLGMHSLFDVSEEVSL